MAVEFIAEIGGSHEGDVGRLRELIQAAESCGFDSVKLQWIESVEDVYRKGFPGKVQTLPENLDLDDVLKWVRSMRLGFSVFNEDHIPKLRPYADFWKVSSYDAGRSDLIQALGQTAGLHASSPVLVSMGLIGLYSVPNPLDLRLHHPESALLHSVSKYPCALDKVDFHGIWDCRFALTKTPFRWGYSDHTGAPAAIYRAVLECQSKVVEMHFDSQGGGHRWSMQDASRVIRETRQAQEANGRANQEQERKWMADPSDGRRPLKRYEAELRASLEVPA